MLSAYVTDNQRKWDTLLQKVACAMRTSKHEVTNLTPFFINFGREHISSGDIYEKRLGNEQEPSPDAVATDARPVEFRKVYTDVIRRLRLAFDRAKRRYDSTRRPLQLEEGDRVYRKNQVQSQGAAYFSSKLAPKFTGPFIVKKKCPQTLTS